MNFVLAITNFERLNYLKKIVDTWEKTKSKNNWLLIIADDGSGGETLEYFRYLKDKKRDYELRIIRSVARKTGVAHLTNFIFKELEEYDFDFCFRSDNDVYFVKEGWDIKYYEIAQKTGFYHLIYNDNSHIESELWDKEKNRVKRYPDFPVAYGIFFTLNKDILKNIGYFDVDSLGPIFQSHWDYSQRCAIGGYNELYKMWDIGGGNQYIKMWGKDGNSYTCSLSEEKRNKGKFMGRISINKLFVETFEKKRDIYIPFSMGGHSGYGVV